MKIIGNKPNHDPKTIGANRKTITKDRYIGCLTIEYKPVSIILCSSCISIVLEAKLFCFITLKSITKSAIITRVNNADTRRGIPDHWNL